MKNEHLHTWIGTLNFRVQRCQYCPAKRDMNILKGWKIRKINENQTVRQYARKQGIPLTEVYKRIADGKLIVKKIGNTILIPIN
jgi:hypothetical protein